MKYAIKWTHCQIFYVEPHKLFCRIDDVSTENDCARINRPPLHFALMAVEIDINSNGIVK